MINEANEPSSTCRLWRTYQVETSTPPKVCTHKIVQAGLQVKRGFGSSIANYGGWRDSWRVTTASHKNGPLTGHRCVSVPEEVVAAARRQPLLRGLLATGAGYLHQAAGPLSSPAGDGRGAALLFCVRGGGWCELGGQLHTVGAGQVLVLPPDAGSICRGHGSRPWSLHWVQAAGEHWPGYMAELGVSAQAPVVWVGQDLQLARLFHEVLEALERGLGFVHLLEAAQALGHLLAVMVRRHREQERATADNVQKVAQSIIYMSEHLDQPLRMTALAALANLSPAHFTVLFKAQTGCSPRDYLRLLRIHRACQLLRGSALHVKEIAAQLGYQDQFHFSRQFKAFQGLSPSEYRGAGGTATQ